MTTHPHLSQLSAGMLTALRVLERDYEPHPCGGFTSDDMQWLMRRAFTPAATLDEALNELLEAHLIEFAGYDENDAIGTCYTLTTSL